MAVGRSGDPRRPQAVPTARCGGGEGEAHRKPTEDSGGAVLGFNTGEEPALRRLSSDNGSPERGAVLGALV
jgi:hypothetical protein